LYISPEDGPQGPNHVVDIKIKLNKHLEKIVARDSTSKKP
jgi:hypothetical protein